MAGFLYTDGFDHYTAMPGSAGAKWNNYIGPDCSIGGSYARYGSTGGFRINNNLCGIGKTGFGNLGTWYIGFAYYRVASVWNDVLFTLLESSTRQIAVRMTPTGSQLQVFRGNWDSGSVYTCNITTSLGVWDYFEFKVIVHSSAGRVIIKQNEVEVGDSGAGGINTSNTGNAYAQEFWLGHNQLGYSNADRYYDDLYIHDTDFQGDCRIIYRPPAGVGSNSEWEPSASDDNYDMVNESVPSTTDYVESDTVDARDTYAIQNLTQSGGSVLAVVGNYYCQKADAGSRQIGMTSILGSEETVSAGQVVPSSWGFLQFIQDTKPGGGSWTVDDVNDAEIGMDLTT